jgi:hypothetical protein
MLNIRLIQDMNTVSRVAFYTWRRTRPTPSVSRAQLSILFRRSPRRAEPAILLHAVQGGVQRTFLDAKDVGRDALDVRRDGVAVQRSRTGQGAKHEQVEGALEDVVSGSGHGYLEFYA